MLARIVPQRVTIHYLQNVYAVRPDKRVCVCLRPIFLHLCNFVSGFQIFSNNVARDKEYNQPGFFRNIFGRGEFAFDPQFSTAKLDYDFVEHRNLSELGTFIIKKHEDMINDFVDRSH